MSGVHILFVLNPQQLGHWSAVRKNQLLLHPEIQGGFLLHPLFCIRL